MSFIKKVLDGVRDTHIPLKNKLSVQFAMQIEQLRHLKKMSQKDLAEKVGTSQAYITKVMQGEANYTVETMAKFAFALDADIDIKLREKSENIEEVIQSISIVKMSHKSKRMDAVNHSKDYTEVLANQDVAQKQMGAHYDKAPDAA